MNESNPSFKILNDIIQLGDANNYNSSLLKSISKLIEKLPSIVVAFKSLHTREMTGQMKVDIIKGIEALSLINDCFSKLKTFLGNCLDDFGDICNFWTYTHFQQLCRDILKMDISSIYIDSNHDQKKFKNWSITKGERKSQLKENIQHHREGIEFLLSNLEQLYNQHPSFDSGDALNPYLITLRFL